MLIIGAAWVLWGFGIETVGRRLVLELDGVVTSRVEIPRTLFTHGTGTIYVLRGEDAIDHEYIAGGTDVSLPRSIPIGTHIKKRRWELSYLENGVRVDDFPVYFYSAMGVVALGCLVGGALGLVRQP